MRKETTRYKMNRFLSEMPLTKVSFQSDVSRQDLPAIQSYLNRLCSNTSLTLIVIENHTPKSIL